MLSVPSSSADPVTLITPKPCKPLISFVQRPVGQLNVAQPHRRAGADDELRQAVNVDGSTIAQERRINGRAIHVNHTAVAQASQSLEHGTVEVDLSGSGVG